MRIVSLMGSRVRRWNFDDGYHDSDDDGDGGDDGDGDGDGGHSLH